MFARVAIRPLLTFPFRIGSRALFPVAPRAFGRFMDPGPAGLPVVAPGLPTVPVFGFAIVPGFVLPTVPVFVFPPIVEVSGLVPMLLVGRLTVLVAGLVLLAGAWLGGAVRLGGAC